MVSAPMLKTLLAERFQLKTHHESREVPIYELTVAKSGARLQPSSDATCAGSHKLILRGAGEKLKFCGLFLAKGTETPGLLSVNTIGITLDAMCVNLSQVLDRPVADKTGIKGEFDLHAEFSPDQTTPGFLPGSPLANSMVADAPGPSLFTALQQQLGLNLEPAKGPREFLVIDHVGRPTAT